VPAMEKGDVKAFDEAFWSHVGMVVRNTFRAKLLSFSRGRLASSPVGGPAAKYYRKLAWASASFSILADLALALMGGTLKRKEMITGRFADIFSWLYLATATLQRFEAEGRRAEDLPLLRYAMATAFSKIQTGFDALHSSLRLPLMGPLFRGPVGAWARLNRLSGPPTDTDVQALAAILMTPGDQRDRLTDGMYVSSSADRPTGRLDRAMLASLKADGPGAKVRRAGKKGELPRGPLKVQLSAAVEAGLITAAEADDVRAAESLRDDAIQVDAFPLEEYLKTSHIPG
ncbi:MAG: DUF1974 domain-containing protein, partial [Bacteroidota bacterium]|nr:DUF1974 domain-containing protein [Bacteroidota bacterium]